MSNPVFNLTFARTSIPEGEKTRVATREEHLALPALAASAGATSVRVQTYDTGSITIPGFKHPLFDLGTADNPLYLHQIYDNLGVNYITDPLFHREMKEACDRSGIAYAVSLYAIEDADAILPVARPDMVVIDQNEAYNYQLLEHLGQNFPSIPLAINLSTSDKDRMTETCNLLTRHYAPEKLILNYGACGIAGGQKNAAPEDSFYADVIPDMQASFGSAVGHADQTPGIQASLVAASRGASFLDKVATMRRGQSPAPSQVVTLDEFAEMVRGSKAILAGTETAPTSYGRPGIEYPGTAKCPVPNNVFPVGFVAQKDIKAGDPLGDAIAGKRIAPAWQNAVMGTDWPVVQGLTAATAIPKNTIIEWSMVSP